jgi:chromosome segregation ATPase
MTQDPRVKRLLVVSVILIFICIVCIFVSVRYVEKYRNKTTETAALEQKLDGFEQNVKRLDIKIKELEARRYDLSLEKEQITKDYTIIKNKYVFLGKMIKALEGDVGTLQRAMKTSEEIEEESDEADSELKILQNRNDKLLQELAKKTKEKMILEIAFEAQAKRLGLEERHDPDLKKTIKDFVTSLQ